MISSAKMHKAEGVLRRLLPFRQCVQTILASLLSSDAPVSSPLTEKHASVTRVAIAVLGSDDGLCGAYNVNIFKGVLEELAKLRSTYGSDIQIDIIPVGKKMAKAFARIGEDPAITLLHDSEINSKSDGDTVKAFAQILQDEYIVRK